MTQSAHIKFASDTSAVRVGIISEKLPGLTLGGGEALAAWMAQALLAHYQVTLLIADPQLSASDLDRLFGTQLTDSALAVRVMPVPRGLHLVMGLREFKRRFLVRYYRQIADEFGLLINASGEGCFRYPGIQYINFPRTFQGIPNGNVAHRLYRKLIDLIPSDPGSLSANLTLTNSKWAADQISRAYGIHSTVLSPPIAFAHPPVPWSSREQGFLIVGRLSPEKRVEASFEILERVRQRRFDVHLHVVGGVHDPVYASTLGRIARRHGDWITFEGQVTRTRLEELITTHRYGIHCMLEEHFGMAAAEMMRGGCIVFVPDGGGQVEVVGDPISRYTSVDDAVERICAVLGSQEEQARLLAASASSVALSHPDDFCRAFLEHCRRFLEESRRASLQQTDPHLRPVT